MKIRNGFVSNSSSSSFIVIMKNGEKMSKEILIELFDIKENSILFGFADKLSDWMMSNIKEQNIEDIYRNYVGDPKGKSTEELIDDFFNEYCELSTEELEKIVSKEYVYYEGSASDDSGDGLETFLCETGINVNNDTIKIRSGGNY